MEEDRAVVPHARLAARFVADADRTTWHDAALWFVRVKRDRAAAHVPEWEELRELASRIKAHLMSRLPEYLEQFESNAARNGAVVHWARDGEEHNRIVLEILNRHNARRVVKSKSMLTEECRLNPYLEARGIGVVDTDLGERIVQLRNEPPSHIVLPAIHLRKADVGATFHEQLGTPAGESDAGRLTRAACDHLRERFLAADAAITGVNFGIAETGGIVVCTNEGNADLGASIPRLHIASMGIEKLVPRARDLAVFTRLLARSATGQPITTYTSHFHGPRAGAELHIVLVDNGRGSLLARGAFRRALHCIRCGACMNTCPVYRRSGGYSYSATVPGPIGSILAPQRDPKAYHHLPFACTLCGSCTDVCPVRIDLHHQLLAMRREIAAAGHLSWSKRWPMKIARWVFGSPSRYERAGRTARWIIARLPRRILLCRWNPWSRQRELPPMPSKSFRDWYRESHERRSPTDP
ncbi:MAG: lactate utilization protein [Planctomycetes bacterium]|nr:lactate utilization protein [Planctomycetota bacterium]